MECNPCLSLVFFLMLSCFVASSYAKTQADALHDLYKHKFKANSVVDTSLFDAIDDPSHLFEETKYADISVEIHDYPRQKELKGKDRINRLPGQPNKVNISQYGGYVTVDKVAGRAFYYYFVEAQHSKESLPLLLWLNGGPGCSSLGYGALQELGPFRVHSDGKTLFYNKYSWNKVANVLFLESPAGVGFSYSNRTSDYAKSGDRRTAADNYMFLVNWLKRFPEHKNKEFYISGESYAGHYVPQLAHTILRHNKKANPTIINLKGIMIGNAVINGETDTLGMYDFFATHALTSYETGHKIHQYCTFTSNANQSNECQAAMNKADEDVNAIDIYNIYAPLCLNGNLTAKPRKTSLMNMDPCNDYFIYAYLNRADVQEAMHANVTKLTQDWQSCSVMISDWHDSPSTIIPILQELMAKGLRVWIFSGDTDGRVPATSTQYSINSMKLSIKTEWRPWYHKGEVGGYVETYKGALTFATVRGAGHEVAAYQPIKAFSLVTHFLAGTPLPKAKNKKVI